MLTNVKLVQITIEIICFVGLIFQSILLLIQYREYKTVVNIEQKHIVDQSVPAITICYHYLYSQETIKVFNKEHGYII